VRFQQLEIPGPIFQIQGVDQIVVNLKMVKFK